MALEVAQNKCALVHYDVTPWNIVLQRLDEPIRIDYTLEKKVYRVKTNLIPVIIDYGKSSVIVEQEHHGFINMFEFSPMQDIITLLFFVFMAFRFSVCLLSALFSVSAFLFSIIRRQFFFFVTVRKELFLKNYFILH